jgi:hypothetical protein
LGIEFESCTKILSDQSRQDAHVHHTALEFELRVLDRVGLPIHVISALRKQIKTRGLSRRGILYSRLGGRNTGDPHTSSGNSLMNALITMLALTRMCPNIDWNDPSVAIAIQGDDSFIICATEWAEQYWNEEMWYNTWLYYGFKVKFVEVTQDLTRCDYCSKLFWPTDDHVLGYLLGPKPGKTLSKLGWSTRPHTNVYKHNRCVALGLKPAVGHVPFLREYVNRVLAITDRPDCQDAKPDLRKYKVETTKPVKYCERTWEFLDRKYDLSHSDLQEFVEVLNTIEELPFHHFSYSVEKMMRVDLE